MNAHELRLSPEALVAEQARQKKAKAARSRRPVRRVAGPSRKERKRIDRKTRKERMAEIARAVLDRADGRCEVCLTEDVLHVHHIVAGSGMRRTYESAGTCIALCLGCHKAAHASGLDTLRGIQAWAQWHADLVAQDAISIRIAKIEEARSSASEATK